MSLALPEAIEPHLTGGFEQIRDPAVYVLDLNRPKNVGEAWDEIFQTRPGYFGRFLAASEVVYVGATHDLLGRLEDHRDSEVRKAALLQVCEIDGLRNVHWFGDADRAFEREHGIAMQLQNDLENAYVHSR